MVNPIHKFNKTDSRRCDSTPVIHEQREIRDARKKFEISFVARWRNTPLRHVLRTLALLLYSLTPLAAQEASHSQIVVDVKTADLNAQPVAANWLSYNGDYTGQRLSNLGPIYHTNGKSLGVQQLSYA